MAFDKTAYMREYTKQKIKRIPLNVTKEDYEVIKAYADSHEESVNGFIKRAIRETIERDKHNI